MTCRPECDIRAQSTCTACGWTGDAPAIDLCPKCGKENALSTIDPLRVVARSLVSAAGKPPSVRRAEEWVLVPKRLVERLRLLVGGLLA